MTVSTSTPSPSARRSMSSMPRIRRPRLTTFGASGWRRPKARSCEASFEPREMAADGRLQALLGAAVALDVAGKQLQIAADDLQHVVEVVRDAAGELADRLHLLRLEQLRLGLGALGDRGGDALLQQFVGLLQNLFGFLAVGDVDDRADMAEKRAVVAEARAGGADRPAVAAVAAPEPVFDPERTARRIGLEKDPARLLAILGMQGFPGAEAERLLHALAGVFGPQRG